MRLLFAGVIVLFVSFWIGFWIIGDDAPHCKYQDVVMDNSFSSGWIFWWNRLLCLDYVQKTWIHYLWSPDYFVVKIIWQGPFCGTGGYATEARTQALALLTYLESRNFTSVYDGRTIYWNVDFIHHGTDVHANFKEYCEDLHSIPNVYSESDITIRILHSTPNEWPDRKDYIDEYWVGRTMYETYSVPFDWMSKLKMVDQLWLPAQFNVDTFSKFFEEHRIPFLEEPEPKLYIIEEGMKVI